MFDWNIMTNTLYQISKDQMAQFLKGPDKEDLYGAGYYCDANEGVIYLVANTEGYYKKNIQEFEKQFGVTDKEVFRWDIGNWKYPGGLFPSSSPEQIRFEKGWEKYQEAISYLEEEEKQVLLEKACIKVLERLVQEEKLPLQGVTVLGPDDQGRKVLGKRRLLS